MKTTIASLILLFSLSLSLHSQSENKTQTIKAYPMLTSEPGFITINEVMYGFGLGLTNVPYSKYLVGLTTTEGYQINRNFVIGAGTGFLVYNGGNLVPLFGDIRYRLDIDPVTPYFYGDAGGLLDFSSMKSSKLFVNVGGGGQYAFTSQLAVTLAAGVMVQTMGWRDTFITIKAGVTYKF